MFSHARVHIIYIFSAHEHARTGADIGLDARRSAVRIAADGRITERSGIPFFTSVNYCHRSARSDEPCWTTFHSLELWRAPPPTHTAHKHV